MPTLTFHPYSDFASIIGVKKGGKTTYTRELAKYLPKKLIIDPTYQLGSLGYCVHYPERLGAAFNQWRSVVYQPKTENKEAWEKVFKTCLRFANYTLVVDEIDQFASSKRYISNDVKIIVVRGRAQGIGLIVNTRRPSDIHKDIRANSDHVVVFRTVEAMDLKYVSQWIGINEIEIKQLPDYWSFYYQTSTHTALKQEPIQL